MVEICREIIHHRCEATRVPFDQNELDYLLREDDVTPERDRRSVQRRDILRTLVGIARYRDLPPTLKAERTDCVCQSSFVDL